MTLITFLIKQTFFDVGKHFFVFLWMRYHSLHSDVNTVYQDICKQYDVGAVACFMC